MSPHRLFQRAFLLFVLLGSSNGQGNPEVTLHSGIYEGLSVKRPGSETVVHKYLGIPFASPPVRFAPPSPVGSSKDRKKANKLPPACIQNTASPDMTTGLSESEDCLYLNVFTPASNSSKAEPKTVMVWIFGGALQFGSASVPTYDGTSFAANQDVVLVAINYRTNVFGFPGPMPGMPVSEQNLGFLDQRMALAWVQDNIASFGGDPNKVTIFGESAGARSVDFLILAGGPPQKPLFRAGIMQSGSSALSPGGMAQAGAKGKGAAKPPLPLFELLGREVGCSVPETVLECMRKVPAKQIRERVVKGFGSRSFGATFDNGRTAVLNAEKARAEHTIANVSLLIGTNADELKQSIGGIGGTARNSTLQSFLDTRFGDNNALKEDVKKTYTFGPNSVYKTEFDLVAALPTVLEFTCVTSRESQSSAKAGYPTWRYFYDGSPKVGESYHASEIQYVFGNIRPTPSPTPAQFALSKVMQSTWARFAKDPTNGPGWSRVGSSDGKTLGVFHRNGTLSGESPDNLDMNCKIFQKYLDTRVSNS